MERWNFGISELEMETGQFHPSLRQNVSDLEERAFQFSKAVRLFAKTIPQTIANLEDEKQLVSASGCAGANYIEANEALSDKDFLVRAKICRKKLKESRYWLRLISETNDLANVEAARALIREAEELERIYSSLIEKSRWRSRER